MTMRSAMWLFLLVFGLSWAQVFAAAQDQGKKSSGFDRIEVELVKLTNKYEDILRERALKILNAGFDEGEYLFQIQVIPNIEKFRATLKQPSQNQRGGNEGRKPIELLSLPTTVKPAERANFLLSRLDETNISLFVKRIIARVIVDQSVSAEKQQFVRESVGNALAIDSGRGDKLVLQTQALLKGSVKEKLKEYSETVERLDRAEREKDNLKSDLRSQATNRTQLESQIQQLESAISREKSEKTDLEIKVRELQDRIQKLEEDLSIYQTPLGEIKKIVKGLELPLTILPFALLMFSAVLIFAIMFVKSKASQTGKVMSAFESLAGAISKVGSGSRKGGDANAASLEALKKGLKKAASQNDTASNLSPEELQRLSQASQEAWKSVQSSLFLVLRVLTDWIDEGQSDMVAALLGVVPSGDSRKLMKNLSKDRNKELVEIMQEAPPSGSGERALIRLSHEVSLIDADSPEWLASLPCESVFQLSEDELLAFSEQAGAAENALLMCMGPGQMALQLSKAQCDDRGDKPMSQSADEVFSLLREIPQWSTEQASQVADQIETGAKKHTSQVFDELPARLAYLMDNANDKGREALGRSLQAVPHIKERVMRSVVTIDHVFKMDKETLQEIIENFSNDELAILVAGLKPENQAQVSELLSPRVMAQVKGEVDRILASPALMRRNVEESRALQRNMINEVKALIEKGVLEHPEAAA